MRLAELTKIAHRHSLAIFTADEGIAGNSARTILTHSLHRRNRGSLAIFFAEEIANLGASKNREFGGAVKIAAAAAENRAILMHSGPWEHIPKRDAKLLLKSSKTAAA